jgi:hypothetical protein
MGHMIPVFQLRGISYRTTLPFLNLDLIAEGMSFFVILTEGRFPRKIQNTRKVFMAVTFVVGAGRTVPRQHQNLNRFSVENTIFFLIIALLILQECLHYDTILSHCHITLLT